MYNVILKLESEISFFCASSEHVHCVLLIILWSVLKKGEKRERIVSSVLLSIVLESILYVEV